MYHKLPSFKEVKDLQALDHFFIESNNESTHTHIHTSKHIKKFNKPNLVTLSKLQEGPCLQCEYSNE